MLKLHCQFQLVHICGVEVLQLYNTCNNILTYNTFNTYFQMPIVNWPSFVWKPALLRTLQSYRKKLSILQLIEEREAKNLPGTLSIHGLNFDRIGQKFSSKWKWKTYFYMLIRSNRSNSFNICDKFSRHNKSAVKWINFNKNVE